MQKMINTSTVVDIVAKNQLNILIQLAVADKHFASEEREMILRICRQKNFPDEEVRQMIQNPEPIGSLGALSNNQKLNYLLGCIKLVIVDHKIFESELNFCKGIALKMGLKVSVVDYILKHHDNTSIEVLSEKVFTEYLA